MPKVAVLACVFLLGWNVALLTALVGAIAIGAAINQLIGPFDLSSPWFYVTATCSLIAAIGSGVFTGVRLRRWFATLRPTVGYVWLAGLLFLTALSFPGRFFYSLS